MFAFDKFAGNSVIRAKTPINVKPGRDEEGNLITTLQAHGEQFFDMRQELIG